MTKKLFTPLLILTIIVGFLSITGCNDKDVTVVYLLDDQTVCIPANPNWGDYETQRTITRAELEAAFSTAGVSFSLDKIRSIKFFEFKIQVETTGNNFDQFGNAVAFIKAPTASGDGTQIAYSNAIGTGASEITFSMNGDNLADLFKANESLVITVRFTNKQTPPGNAALCVKFVGAKFDLQVAK